MRPGFRTLARDGGFPAPTAPLDYVLADYASSALVNRGTLGALGDLVLNGAAPTVGIDANGSFADFASGGYLDSAAAFDTGYAGTDYTIYVLHDGTVGTAFLFDFMKSGSRLTVRHRSAVPDMQILDGSYKTYEGLATGSTQFSTYVLDGATSEGRGFGEGQVAQSGNPRVYVPQTIDTGVRMGIGALAQSGNSPWTGKIRGIRVYFAAHDLATRQAVEAEFAAEWPGVFA